MSMPTVARWAIPLFGLLAVAGCSTTEGASEPSVEQTAAAVGDSVAFCTRFPTPDAGRLLAIPDTPELEGNVDAIDQLMEIGANGLADSAPADIRPEVERFVAALRQYPPDTHRLAEPSLQADVDRIDAWLRDNCPAPPATAPPGTSP